MWFKVFVLLRIPISAVCLLGYGTASAIWDWGAMGAPLALGAFVFLAVASIQLVRLKPGALNLGAWLLTVETAGASLLFVAGDAYYTGQVELYGAAVICFGIAALWILPNAFLFYRARGLFVEDAGPKK
jgi:hypothetical protein